MAGIKDPVNLILQRRRKKERRVIGERRCDINLITDAFMLAQPARAAANNHFA